MSAAPELRSIWDLGPITTEYGAPSAFTGEPHPGVDLGVPIGTLVPAPAGGTVERVWRDPIGGLQAAVRSSGFLQVFAHLTSAAVSPGQRVEAGQPIGWSGASGKVTGPNLHYEVRNGSGQAVDPRTFLGEFGGVAPTRPAARPSVRPDAWQCTLILALGGTPAARSDSVERSSLLSQMTGIPESELSAAAYACAHGVATTGPLQTNPLSGGGVFGVPDLNLARLGFTLAGAALVLIGLWGYFSSLRGEQMVRTLRQV